MRGPVERQAKMLMGVTVEDFIPAGHPIRRVRKLVDGLLVTLSPQLTAMYAATGRASIPPEHLLKGCLLIALFSVRSERQFCDRLQYDLLFKWFLGLNITHPAFDHSTFSKNRKRLLENQVAEGLLGEVVREARRRRLISEDHFSVDGTLLQAWASQKSVRPRDGQEPPASGGGRNPEVDFHGQKRTNETHVSATDPEALFARKGSGQEARLSYAGHILMENGNGLILDLLVTQATGTAEREAALVMLDRRRLPRKRGDAGRRQGLRHAGIRRGATPTRGDPARHPEHLQPPQRNRRADDPPSWLWREPAGAQAHRGVLRLDQDHGRRTQAALYREGQEPALGNPHGHRPEPRADGEHQGPASHLTGPDCAL